MILPDLDLGLRKIIWQKEDFTKLCKDEKIMWSLNKEVEKFSEIVYITEELNIQKCNTQYGFCLGTQIQLLQYTANTLTLR